MVVLWRGGWIACVLDNPTYPIPSVGWWPVRASFALRRRCRGLVFYMARWRWRRSALESRWQRKRLLETGAKHRSDLSRHICSLSLYSVPRHLMPASPQSGWFLFVLFNPSPFPPPVWFYVLFDCAYSYLLGHLQHSSTFWIPWPFPLHQSCNPLEGKEELSLNSETLGPSTVCRP